MEDLWIIEFSSPDTSRESTEAFHSRAEAVEIAAAFAAEVAGYDLEGFSPEDLGEHYELLRSIVEDNAAGRYDDAVLSWLEYQEDVDPSERIAIGPSGAVSDSAYDFKQFR